MKRVAIITSSDTGYRGEREDLSGPVIKEIVEREGYEVVSMDILPDDQVMLAGKMQEIADKEMAELILTTGGTGFLRKGCHTGGDRRSNRAQSSGNSGGNACIQHDDHKKSHAQPCNGRYSRKDTDHQSSGKSEGSKRKPGLYHRCSGTWD